MVLSLSTNGVYIQHHSCEASAQVHRGINSLLSVHIIKSNILTNNVYEKCVQNSTKPYNQNSRIEFFNPTVLVFVIKKQKVIEQSYQSML